MNKDLIFDIAHEAHTMGRIYSRCGEKNLPDEEIMLVEKMVERRLANVAQPENKSKISEENKIKMQMAKDILIAGIIDQSRREEFVVNKLLLDEIILTSEYIFNKVNK